MFPNYYVNRQTSNPNYNHEVHREGCPWLPSVGNRIYLGQFSSCTSAVAAARQYYANVDGCAICCPACHRG